MDAQLIIVLIILAVAAVSILYGAWLHDQRIHRNLTHPTEDTIFTKDEKLQLDSLIRRMANLKVTNPRRFNRLLQAIFDKLKHMEQE